MNRQRTLALIFLAVALVQVAIPAHRIWLYEQALSKGTPFKFRTDAVDPYDAFRGRYVTLELRAGEAAWHEKEPPPPGTRVFVGVETGPDGFARLTAGSRTRPQDGACLQAEVRYGSADGKLRVDLPLDRFYMEENLAPQAETVYREHSRRSGARDAYAMVRIHQGVGVIEQVFVGDKPLAEAARADLQPAPP